jgi:hypothetical protein
MAAMNPKNVMARVGSKRGGLRDGGNNLKSLMARRSAPWPSSWIATTGGARLVMTNTCS